MAQPTDSNTPTPPTEREKYVANLQSKLEKAGKAGRFKESEDGSILTDFLTDQINGFVKNLGGTKYLSDNDLANYDRGQLAMAQKMLTMLNGAAAIDTTEIKGQLEAAQNDG